jgi:uncharacterized protein (TIGR02271 family)
MSDSEPRTAPPRQLDNRIEQHVVPIVEETVSVTKRAVPTGRVRIHTAVEERSELVRADLEREHVEVERVPLNREVAAMPAVRHEGDVMIVPVVEEVLVIEKRLVLKEELHIRTVRSVERVEEPIVLRRTVASVERTPVE